MDAWRTLKDTFFRGRPIGLLGGDAADEKEFKSWYARFCQQLQTLARAEEGPTALELASTDELTGELQRRYGSMVFAGVRDLSQKDEAYGTRFTGSTAACLGLLVMLRAELLRHHRAQRGD